MKRMIIILLLLVSCFLFSSAVDKVIKIATDPWPPWIIGEEESAPTGGIAVKVVEELVKRLGYNAEVMVFPFARALNNVYTGDYDMILMVSKSPEREEKLVFTDMIMDSPYLIFFDADRMADFSWNKFRDLKPYKIGIVKEFNYGNDWNKAVKRYRLKVEAVKNDSLNLKKLLAGRVDCILMQKENALYLIKNNSEYKGRIKFNSKPIKISSFGFAVSKKSFLAPMISQINAEIDKMRKDGTIKNIMKQELD